MCGDGTFKERHLKLYMIARNRDALVSYYMERINGQVHWNSLFFRADQDWEMESLEENTLSATQQL